MCVGRLVCVVSVLCVCVCASSELCWAVRRTQFGALTRVWKRTQTIESTSKRTKFWAVVEFLAFASANCVQVLVVRRFFTADERRPRYKPPVHTYKLPGEL